MNSFRKVASSLDVGGLRNMLNCHPEYFGEHGLRKRGAHAQMTDIWARYNAIENLDPENPAAFNEEHESVWYPIAEKIPQVKAPVFHLMRIVEGVRLGAVLITKLPAGGEIGRHVDGGWHAQYYGKYFVPIQNDTGAVFHWDDGEIHANPGEAWFFRNDIPHWVTNGSKRDRIAMIVCIKS
jgi:hypothetical protein